MRLKPNTRLWIATASVLVSVALSAPAFAAQPGPQGGQSSDCGPGAKPSVCAQPMRPGQSGGAQSQPSQKGNHKAQAPQHARGKTSPQPPKVGDNARRAPMVQRAKNSRLPDPPPHQHYRVVDEQVVRVDDNTQKIVAVLGLASTLLH